jgi:hypothetical protein
MITAVLMATPSETNKVQIPRISSNILIAFHLQLDDDNRKMKFQGQEES